MTVAVSISFCCSSLPRTSPVLLFLQKISAFKEVSLHMNIAMFKRNGFVVTQVTFCENAE